MSKHWKNIKKTVHSSSVDSSWESSPSHNEYLIISAAQANVVQRVHKPVWKSQRLLDKTSWSGSLDTMQYFATLNYFRDPTKPEDSNPSEEEKPAQEHEEYWLADHIIDVPE